MLLTISKPDIYTLAHNQRILVIILDLISLFTFIVGLAGYQANFIQLGLDQLFEAPSPCLSLFIHYATWAFSLGSLYFLMTAYFLVCSTVSKSMNFFHMLHKLYFHLF